MKGKIGGIATGIIIALILIIAAACSERIPAGYVGVVYNMNGGIENEVLTQGWKFVSPTKKVTKFSIALEPSYMTADKQGDSSDDESFEIPTKEGASLETDVAFSYSYKLEEVPNTFTRFHGQNGEEILKSFEIVDGQTGVLIIINGEIKGFELFLSSEIYKDFHEKILKSYIIGSDVENMTFTINVDRARQVIENAFDSTFESKPTKGLEKAYEFENQEGIGKAYIFENEIIHLSYFNSTSDNESDEALVNADVNYAVRD